MLRPSSDSSLNIPTLPRSCRSATAQRLRPGPRRGRAPSASRVPRRRVPCSRRSTRRSTGAIETPRRRRSAPDGTMQRARRFFSRIAFAAALAFAASRGEAQAFTLPQGVGAFTLAWQYVDNTGHRMTDGYVLPLGQSVSTGVLAEIDYGVTDRLSV